MTTPTTTLVPSLQKPNGFGMMLSPESIEAARDLATMFSKSELVPKAFANKPNDILIAGAMGHRLGLDLFSALAGIAVVNGRPTLWGDAQLAVCQSRPDWDGMKVEETGAGDTFGVTVTITRKGHSEPYVGKFSMADAKKAGLAGKQGPWSQYPTRMCLLRARAFALRSAFADALAGFHAREEIEDEVDVTASATVRAEPKPAKRRTVADPLGLTAGEQAQVEIEAETENKKADAEQQTQTNTIGEHLEQTQAAEQPAAPAAKDFSVAACTREFEKLWKHSDAGKSRAKAIQGAWNLSKIAELAGAADGDRESFLVEVGEALAAVEG